MHRMIDTQSWLLSRAGRTSDGVSAADEPSHIHIPRPSRLLRLADDARRAQRHAALAQAPRDVHLDVVPSAA